MKINRELPNIDINSLVDDISPITENKESRELKKAKKKGHWAEIYDMVTNSIESRAVKDMVFAFLEGRIKKGLTKSQWQLMLDDINIYIKEHGEAETISQIKNSVLKNYMAPIYLKQNGTQSNKTNKIEGFTNTNKESEQLSNKEY